MFVPVAVGVGVALILYGLLRPPKSTSRFYRPGQIALIGDSLGVGLELPLNKILAARNITLDGRAVGATHASQWLTGQHRASLDAALKAGAYAVLISLGTNDCYLDSDYCKAFPSRITKLGQAIRAAGAIPVFLSPGNLPWAASGRVASMEAALSAAAAQSGGIYLHSAGYPKTDGIHYSPAGNQQWAEWIDAELASR